MTSALTPLFATAAGLVLLAGVSKLHSPDTARVALSSIGWPAGVLTVRLIGATEVALGLVCLGWPTPVGCLCLAAAYAVFAVVISLMLRAEDPVPCGCFGAASFSASVSHAFMNLLAAAICAVAALVGVPSLWGAGGYGPAGVVLLLGVAGATYLSFLAFALLPQLWRAHGGGGETA